jgi:hypothetical protein
MTPQARTPRISPFRPTFPTAAAYEQSVLDHRAEGRVPWPPATIDEWLVFIRFYPHARPSRGHWRALDDAIDAVIPPEPLSSGEEGRIVTAMLADPASWGRVVQHCLTEANSAGRMHCA